MNWKTIGLLMYGLTFPVDASKPRYSVKDTQRWMDLAQARKIRDKQNTIAEAIFKQEKIETTGYYCQITTTMGEVQLDREYAACLAILFSSGKRYAVYVAQPIGEKKEKELGQLVFPSFTVYSRKPFLRGLWLGEVLLGMDIEGDGFLEKGEKDSFENALEELLQHYQK